MQQRRVNPLGRPAGDEYEYGTGSDAECAAGAIISLRSTADVAELVAQERLEVAGSRRRVRASKAREGGGGCPAAQYGINR